MENDRSGCMRLRYRMDLMIWWNVIAFVSGLPSCNCSVADGDRGVGVGFALSMSRFSRTSRMYLC